MLKKKKTVNNNKKDKDELGDGMIQKFCEF